jgi:preprotein translocase subunit YajC
MTTLFILIIPLLLLWFLVMRPAQKRQRQAAELRQSIAPGQDIVTVAGMIGTVTEVHDDDIVVSIAPGVEVRMLRGAVGQVRPAPEPDDPEAPSTGGQGVSDLAHRPDDDEPTSTGEVAADPADPSDEGPAARPS